MGVLANARDRRVTWKELTGRIILEPKPIQRKPLALPMGPF